MGLSVALYNFTQQTETTRTGIHISSNRKMDRFTELSLFVQVAERGSLSKAAESLGLSNPAASRCLASLEERVKVRLVERNTRRLDLTREGREFLERARHILSELEGAESALQSATLKPSGVLRVSASLSFSMQIIAPLLPRFHQLYPQLRVHVESANRYLDIIDNGIDVVIRTREMEPDSSITIRRLGTTRRFLAASPAYLAERGVPQHPRELPFHSLLLYVHAKKPHELGFSRGEQRESVTVHGLLESNDGQVLRSAALNDLGILVQPSYILYDDVVAGRLVPVLDGWELPQLTINIAYPSRKHLSAKVRAFINFMVDAFADHDYERKWTGRM
jgi:DNA-binding transcriptional LysR family regulator